MKRHKDAIWGIREAKDLKRQFFPCHFLLCFSPILPIVEHTIEQLPACYQVIVETLSVTGVWVGVGWGVDVDRRVSGAVRATARVRGSVPRLALALSGTVRYCIRGFGSLLTPTFGLKRG